MTIALEDSYFQNTKKAQKFQFLHIQSKTGIFLRTVIRVGRIFSPRIMTKDELRRLLQQYKSGRFDENDLIERLSSPRFESLGFATLDHHRQLRQGFPEVILCQGKTPDQVAKIAAKIGRIKQPLLATRADCEHFAAVKKKIRRARYNSLARTITANEPKNPLENRGTILVVTAGTSDVPVAEEAVVTARMFGSPVDTLYDVGVAGIHRLLSQGEKLSKASVIIVVAGMEGALPSVVGGLVDVPVIAVPTSVGYGASFSGVTALLAMLNSCASGVTVVNIDNGFGAGFAASLMNRKC
jgi:NCAIR mutase (PurE)-related protein